MLCRSCGKEITDDAVSCPYCGALNQERGEAEDQTGSITIYREKAVSAALASAKVSIDGKPYCALKPDERVAVSLPYGKHFVSIRVAMNPASTFAVDLEPGDPAPVLSFKIDLNGKAVMIGEENGIVPVKKKRNNAVRILAILILLAVMIVMIIVGKLTKNDAPDGSAGAEEAETAVISGS